MVDIASIGIGLGVPAAEAAAVAASFDAGLAPGIAEGGYTGPDWSGVMATNFGVAQPGYAVPGQGGGIAGVPGGTVGSSADFPGGPSGGYFGEPVYTGQSLLGRGLSYLFGDERSGARAGLLDFNPIGLLGKGLTGLLSLAFGRDAIGEFNPDGGFPGDVTSVSNDLAIQQILGDYLNTAEGGTTKDRPGPAVPRRVRPLVYTAPQGLDYLNYGFGPEHLFYTGEYGTLSPVGEGLKVLA